MRSVLIGLIVVPLTLLPAGRAAAQATSNPCDGLTVPGRRPLPAGAGHAAGAAAELADPE